MLKELVLQIPAIQRLHQSRNDLDLALKVAEGEKQQIQAQLDRAIEKIEEDKFNKSPFWHYASSFDPIAVIRRHARQGLTPLEGHVTNYLGVRVNTKFFPGLLDQRAGEVEPVPLPGNWHADIAEWGTVLRAVELSAQTFTMIELGCGWGCWMNNSGVAAKQLKRKVHVIGVEGDDGHIKFAQESLATNRFSAEEFTLHRGIAAATSGIALFPRQGISGASWGLEPVFNATPEQHATAIFNGSHDVLPMVPLSKIAAHHAKIDLLHLDIQGGEADFVKGCIDMLNEKIGYLFIGTHSKQIEGSLYDTLLKAGWILEMERPAIFRIHEGKPVITIDGVQGWRNPMVTNDSVSAN